jgi:Glycosyltransferase
MVALHARRSATSIARYRAQGSAGALAVVLTGTDLYRDLPGSAQAKASLDAADHIVVLQDDALAHLERRWRRKARVIFQSAPALLHIANAKPGLRCVVVGHLRDEKSPQTIWEALALLPREAPITIRHIGAALDERLGRAAEACAGRDPRYRYEGALSHARTRSAIRAADLLLHPSVMEGGANVIVEAVMSGTAVLASRMSGNVGMLGTDYPGYFETGDASGLAHLLVQALEDPRFGRTLQQACRVRRALFRPEAEQKAVRRLVTELVSAGR